MTRGLTLPRPRRFSSRSGFAGSVALSMPLGLMSGRPFSPFSRAISSRSAAFVRSSSASFANRPATNSRSWADERSSRLDRGLTHSLHPDIDASAQANNASAPGVLPLLRDDLLTARYTRSRDGLDSRRYHQYRD